MKQKDEDIIGIVTHIVSEYEKATLNGHYELLKDYKQGLFIDDDVNEEIELYEETTAKVGDPTFDPSKNIEQLTTAVPAMADEIRHVAIKPSTTNRSLGKPPESEKVAK